MLPKETLGTIKDTKINRYLFTDEEDILDTKLHTFTDASEEAFAAAVYLRNSYKNGQVV